MFAYEYSNGYTSRKATFYNRWQRLDHCKAAVYDEFHYSSDNALQHEIKIHCFYLISYGTPIAKINFLYDISDGRIITNQIYVNAQAWNCSSTTIHQLSRWLNKLNYSRGISIPYSELKYMMKIAEANGYRSGQSVFPSGTGFSVVPIDDYELENMFFNECPIWLVSKC